MKHIKTFENIIYGDDWKIGDCVVALKDYYIDPYNIIKKDKKYIISEFYVRPTYAVPTPGLLKINNYTMWLHKTMFITEEEWKMRQNVKKYNL